MKIIPLIPVLALLAVTGCSKEESEPIVKPASVKKAPKPQATDEAAAAPAPGSPAVAEAAAEPVPPELAPLQNGLEEFEKANNRLPNNVQEMVEKKIIKSLPPLPAGKIYYIDHATKRVKIGGGP